MNTTYDYIVVGGGSAGCVAAASLCQDRSVSVLLLEAGDPAEAHPETLAADRYKDAFINDALMWDRLSTPQPGCGHNRIYMGSGRGMGGSGSVNAMVYTRGAAYDYDSWGIDGWRAADVVPDFQLIEGRLRVASRPPTEFTETCIAAATQAGFTRKEDWGDGQLHGALGYEWMNADGNQRRSAYVAFLQEDPPPNLTTRTGARARRVLLQAGPTGPHAIGVEFEEGGQVHVAHCRAEVLLCAGALESPKLLMLSGLGPTGELSRHGIPVRADLPGVGQNLHDHPNVGVFCLGSRPTDCSWAQLYGFHRAGTSVPPGQADTCYVFYSARSSFREGLLRLLPAMVLPLFLYRKPWAVALVRRLILLVFSLALVRRLVDRLYAVIVILGKPKSRGRLTLASADPRAPAVLDPAYLSHPDDAQALADGVVLARSVCDAAPLSAWGNREVIPGRFVRRPEALLRYVRKNAITTYHYAGTCRMGHDDAAVVDPRLRVRGVTGLRVADASIMPSVPVSALNATSMLIGLRAARYAEQAREPRSAAEDDHVTGAG